MLHPELFKEQAKKFAIAVSHITMRYPQLLKKYGNPAKQICRVAHTATETVLYINGFPPASVVAELQAAYEGHFDC